MKVKRRARKGDEGRRRRRKRRRWNWWWDVEALGDIDLRKHMTSICIKLREKSMHS